jgi:cytochrome c
MRNLDNNKLFAAILIALFLERLTGIWSDALFSIKSPSKNAYPIGGNAPEKEVSSSSQPKQPETIEPLLAQADIKKGQIIAKKCLQCHVFKKEGPHRIGPSLYNVFGKKIGWHNDYPYSKAFQEKEGVWNDDSLNAYLYKPRGFIEGTKMSFAGIEKAQDRADLIRYLRSLSDTPAPLP